MQWTDIVASALASQGEMCYSERCQQMQMD